MQKCIDPLKLKLKVTGIGFSPQNSVILEGPDFHQADSETWATLSANGLEIKPTPRIFPRLIIHDIPVIHSSEDIVKHIVEQDLLEATLTDVKAVYLYPPEKRSFAHVSSKSSLIIVACC